jgi:threonine/homoserine/homoserine lactone efflux protein
MILLDMGLQIVFVSASGVLTPGPLFFTNLALSKYGGFWSGIKIAVGHTIVELPVIILYSFPLIAFTYPITSFNVFKVISIIGGASLIIFGNFYMVKILSINDSLRATVKPSRIENPILAGILFTGVNPFFYVWWFSVGVKLLSDSLQLLGYPLGIVFLFFCAYMDGLCLVGNIFIHYVKRYQDNWISISQVPDYTFNASSFLLRHQFHYSCNQITDIR